MEWWNGGIYFSSILFACLSTTCNYILFYGLYSFQFACFYFRQSCFSPRLCVFCVVDFSIGNKSRHSVDKNSSETFKHVFYQVQIGNSCMEVVVGAVF